jgi:RNA polymerase sigma-70 factor (ECF subfamily)
MLPNISINDLTSGHNLTWKKTWDHYYPILVRKGLWQIKDEEEAKTIASDTLAKVYYNRSGFSSVNDLERFIYTTNRNACIDFLRKKVKGHMRFVPIEDEEMAEPDAGLTEDHYAVRLKIGQQVWHMVHTEFPQREREVFLLRWLQNLMPAQIAKILSITAGTVSNLLDRSKRRLQKRFKNLPFFCFAVVLMQLSHYVLSNI